MTIVTVTAVPAESALQSILASADFSDAYAAPLSNPALTPVEIFLFASRSTPEWISRLMAVRNALARQIGLKDVGYMTDNSGGAASDYRVGSRIGIFDVIAIEEHEVVVGIDDSHLDVRVSIFKTRTMLRAHYIVSTVVHIKSLLGRAYMLPVGRIHSIVVRSMMRRAAA